MKRCNVCNIEKPTDCFGKDSTRKDGLKYKCKACRKNLAKNSKANKAWKVENWHKVLENQCKKRCKEKNTICEIDSDFIKELYNKQNGKCFWFKVDLIPSVKKKYPFQPSIDRIDNSKGYTKDNVVLCCFSANFARNENDFETFKTFCDALFLKKQLNHDSFDYKDSRYKQVRSPDGLVYKSAKEAAKAAGVNYKKFKKFVDETEGWSYVQ